MILKFEQHSDRHYQITIMKSYFLTYVFKIKYLLIILNSIAGLYFALAIINGTADHKIVCPSHREYEYFSFWMYMTKSLLFLLSVKIIEIRLQKKQIEDLLKYKNYSEL